ncbi:type II toxin-antitoxin system RelE/ParE family toxin [bacterium]|nr:type II toxin-antitoxin system RelE/ParE family toxin [bacterium]
MRNEYLIRLLRLAEEDLNEIILFIAQDNPPAAENMATNIEKNIQMLASHPLLGKVPNESELAGAGYRYLIVDNYLIFYTIEEETIFVHRIIHGARDYRRLL